MPIPAVRRHRDHVGRLHLRRPKLQPVRIQLKHGQNLSIPLQHQNLIICCFYMIIIIQKPFAVLRENPLPQRPRPVLFLIWQVSDHFRHIVPRLLPSSTSCYFWHPPQPPQGGTAASSTSTEEKLVSFRREQMAWEEMPSPVPVKPSPSSVVAFTFT